MQLLGYLLGASKEFEKKPVGAYYLKIQRSTSIEGGVFFKAFNKKYFTIHHSNKGLIDKEFEMLMSAVF